MRLPFRILARLGALPLRTRTALWAALGIAVLAAALVVYLVDRERHDFLQERGAKLLHSASTASVRLQNQINQLRQSILFLAHTPALQGIARVSANRDMAPANATPPNLWRNRLESVFSVFAESHPSYYQIRYIGLKNQGQELVRVDLVGGKATVTAPEDLQRKAHRDYFQAGLKLRDDEVYFSEINLNRDYGQVQVPHRPTIRAVTPVYAVDGELLGMLTINRDIGSYLDSLSLDGPIGAQVYLANHEGDFLVHPDRDKTFGFDLGKRNRIDLNSTKPDSLRGATSGDKHVADVGLRVLPIAKERMYAISKSVQYAPRQPDRQLTFIYATPENAVAAEVKERVQPLVVVVLLTALVLMLLVRVMLQRVFSPLSRLSAIARQVGDGQYDLDLPTGSTAEEGALLHAFGDMLERIKERDAENTELYLELRQSESFASSVIETTPEAILVVGPDGCMVRVNSKTEQLFGYLATELIGKPVEILLPEGNRKRHERQRRDYMSAAAARVMGAGRTLHGLRKNGEQFPVEIDLGPLHVGDRQFVIACVLDVSERKAAQDEVAALNATLEQQVIERTRELQQALVLQQAIFQHAGLALITSDPQGVITAFNPAATTMLGYKADEAIGCDTSILIHDRNEIDARAAQLTVEFGRPIPADFNAVVAKSIHGQVDTNEWTYTRKDGSHVPVLLSITTLFDEQRQILGHLEIAADLTERQLREQQLRQATEAAEAANRAKSDFLANMSHEIRTPMNGVIGLTQLLMDTPLNPQQWKCVSQLRKTSQALMSILNDILDFSKVEAGRLEVEEVDFQVDELLDTTAGLFSLAAEEKGIEILLRVGPKVPATVRGDPLRLSQVLNNLVGNAVKFTEQGVIEINVDVAAAAQANGTVETDASLALRICVSDTGVGMTSTQVDQLFQPFQQADTSITRKYGGTGLGLTISQRIVQMMNGDMAVESTPGKGSTISFTVLLRRPHDASQPGRLTGQLRGMKALVVDDQQTSLEILSEILSSWDFKVERASDAAAGLEKLLRAEQLGEPFELFLIDWKMPSVDGIEMAREIEKLIDTGTITRSPMVIMVTAHGHDQVLTSAGPLQLNAVLDKPVTASRLYDILVGIQDGQCPAHTAVQAEQGGRLQQLARPIQGARILLVEDNATNQFIAQQFLGKMELHVDVANNGAEAVEMVAAGDYAAVLMDLQMPVMDGIAATRQIRATDKGRELPIVAMTAAAMLKDREATLAVGMNGHIAKPVIPEELASTLVECIRPQVATIPRLPAAPVAVETAHQQPFTLPGLNLAQAVQRLDNHWGGLRNVLRMFHRDFADAVTRLDDDLANNRYADAKRLAHTIKGLAESIGAEHLAATARRFEQELATGTTESRQDFVRDLNAALAAVGSLDATPEAIAATLPAEEAVSITELGVLLRDLAGILEESIIVPAALQAQVRHGLHSRVSDASIHQFMTLVSQFDYAGAQQSLETIADEAGIDLAS